MYAFKLEMMSANAEELWTEELKIMDDDQSSTTVPISSAMP